MAADPDAPTVETSPIRFTEEAEFSSDVIEAWRADARSLVAARDEVARLRGELDLTRKAVAVAEETTSHLRAAPRRVARPDKRAPLRTAATEHADRMLTEITTAIREVGGQRMLSRQNMILRRAALARLAG